MRLNDGRDDAKCGPRFFFAFCPKKKKTAKQFSKVCLVDSAAVMNLITQLRRQQIQKEANVGDNAGAFQRSTVRQFGHDTGIDVDAN